jgi:signal transduction histidine kinase/DNA-binding response OmpR family regulator
VIGRMSGVLPASGSTTDAGGIRVLVVEDERTIAHVIQNILEENGCEVRVASSAEESLALLEAPPPEVALVDILLPGMNGLELLGKIKARSPDAEVVIMTSHASVETAVQAIRRGAYDYLQKPFEDIEDVWSTVRRAYERRELLLQNRALLREAEQRNRELSTALMRLGSLNDAGRAMATFQALPELLDFVLGLVAEELEVDRASLMLLEEGTEYLRIVASRGLSGVDAGTLRVRIGEGIAGSVARTGEPFLVTDIRNDPRMEKPQNPSLSDSFISAPIVLSMPIKSRETVLGVINVTNRRSGGPFGDDDVSYLTGLAGQVAVAVERTKHVEDLRRTFESLKAAQEQIVRSERLRAVGEMAAGVAHDFNNSLSVVMGRAQVVLRRLQGRPVDLERVRSDIETIRKVSEQTAATIRRIQDYTGGRRDLSETPVDINAVVRDAVDITRPKWMETYGARSRQIEVRLDLKDVPPIAGIVHDVTQVVGNLIFNAVDAMPEGGVLTFRTHRDDERVVLEVEDTGVGMTADVQARLFEPFFTTKENGQGLGASIIYGIVSRHRGDITVKSEPDKGTVFKVRFPQAPPDLAVSPVRTDPPSGEGKGLRVLLVEDETLVRETFAEALAALGHEVEAFASGTEALTALRNVPFHVVITDLAMPEMSGFDVARQVKEVKRDLPVILLSGWLMQQDDAAVRESGVDYVLAKPCLIEKLVETVHRATELRTGDTKAEI